MSVISAGEWKPRLVGSYAGNLAIRVPIDLTSEAATMTLWNEATGAVKVSAAACVITIISATIPESQVTWTPTAADVDTAGSYLAAFDATEGGATRRLGYVRLRIKAFGPPFS